jgi:Rrf2 family protein
VRFQHRVGDSPNPVGDPDNGDRCILLQRIRDFQVDPVERHCASYQPRAGCSRLFVAEDAIFSDDVGLFLSCIWTILAWGAEPDNVDLASRALRGHIRQMITHKTKYALKALMVLANEKAGDATALRIEEIAGRSGAPKRFLEHILLDLKRAGLIGSRRGRNGGYEMIKDPKRVSLAEVLRLIDGPLAPLPCLSRKAYQRCEDCKDEETCGVRAVFGSFYATYILLIESLTVADLQRDSRPLEALAPPEPTAEE